MPFEKSAGTVVFRDGEYLLLHYAGGHWDFPKGHVEKGETEEDAALRELREETSLSGTLIEGFRERMQYFFRSKGATVRKEVVFFAASANSREVRLSKEHVGFAWLPYEKALEQLTYKNAKTILKKAHAFLAKKSLKDFAAKP